MPDERYYEIRFYEDVTRHNETDPCELNNHTYKTVDEAEAVARERLPEIRARCGMNAGYWIGHSQNVTVRIGPGVHDDI